MRRIAMFLFATVVALPLPAVRAVDPPTGSPDILPDGAQLETLWTEGDFTEGVAAGPDGMIYFSDIAVAEQRPGRIMKFNPSNGQVTVHCADSGQSNGLFFDPQGRLMAACGALGGHRALVEINADGSTRVLFDKFEGKRFNSPNDLVIDSAGRIYFSDPRYLGPEPLELDAMSVYRIDADGTIQRLATGVTKPNGVHLSPDQTTLYVAETDNGSIGQGPPPENPQLRMTLNALPLNADGSVGAKKVLVDFGAETGVDGMSIDTAGNIYAAVRRARRFGITVFDPQGEELASIPTPDLPTNCTFGVGHELSTLYVTAGKGFYRIKLKSKGFHPTIK